MAKKNPSKNLSKRDRIKGGRKSAFLQKRDDQGRFRGKKFRHKLLEAVAE